MQNLNDDKVKYVFLLIEMYVVQLPGKTGYWENAFATRKNYFSHDDCMSLCQHF